MTWDPSGTGTSDGAGAWLTAGDWWNGTSSVNWTSGDDAIFGNGGAGGAVTLASPTTVNSLTFNSFSGTYTLGTAGQAITLNNGITMNAGAGNATLISPITLGAAQSWTNNSSSLLTVGAGAITNGGFLLTIGGTGNTSISGAISGSGGLTMSGSGTLTLSGANAYTGATTVSSGTLVFSGANRNIPSSTASVASGATLVLATGSSDLRNQGAVTFTGAGVVQKTGTGTWVLGATGVTGGGYAGAAGGTATTVAVVFNQSAGGFFDVNGGDINSGWHNTSFTTNNGSLNVASGASFHTSNPTIQFDSLTGGGVIGSAWTGAVTMTIGVANNANNALYGVAGNTATFGGSIRNSETYNNATTGALSLVKAGTGTQILSGINTFTGTTTVNAGTLTLANALALQNSALVTTGAGTVTLSGVTTPTIGGLSGASGNLASVISSGYSGVTNLTLNPATGVSVTYGGVIADGATGMTLTKTGAGTQILQGANTYTGGTIINGGTLRIAADGSLGSASGGVTFGSGYTQLLTTTSGLTLNAGRTITLNSGAVAAIGQVNQNGAYDFTINGKVTGSGAMQVGRYQLGSGTTYLANTANDFTGSLIIGNFSSYTSPGWSWAGFTVDVASIGDATSLGSGNIIFGNSRGNAGDTATFQWSSSAVSGLTLTNRQIQIADTAAANTIAAIANNNGTAGNALVINSDLLVTATSAKTLQLSGSNIGNNTYAGKIINGSAPISLTKAGSGTWILSGANTFTGATTISGGTLRLANTSALANTSGITMGTASNSLVFGTDTAFTTLPLITGSSSAFTYTLVSDRATAGAGLNHALGVINFGNATFGFTRGSNVASGTAGITFSSAIMTSGAAGTSILNPTTATLTITGGVTSQTNNVARTLQLAGTGTGHSIGGVITQTVASALSLSKTNTSTWTLAGNNTYSGTTSISGGILRFTGDSSGATGNVSVTGGALGGNGGSLGGAVAVSSTGGVDLRDGSVGALTLGSTLGITVTTANANNLYFDLGNGTGTSDQISVAGATTVTNTAGNAIVNINQLGGLAGRNATTYTLIGGAGTLDATNFARFSLSTTAAFGQTYSLANGGTNGDLQLVATNVTSVTPTAFWSGGSNNWGTASNWKDDLGGSALSFAPDYQTNVTFSATGGTNLATNVLDVDFDINSLTFNAAAGGVTIGGTRMLTIEATNANGNTAGNGINSQNTSGTNTISARVGLAANQTWTVASGGTLAVSGVISDFGGAYGLTKAGGGTLSFTSATNLPTYTGATTITGGTFDVSALTSASAFSPLATSGIAFTTADSTFRAAATGTLTVSYPTMSIDSGITVTFDKGAGGNNTPFFIPSLTGGGTFSATNSGGAGTNITFATLAGFTGNLQLNNAVGNAFNTPDLNDAASSKIRMSSSNTGQTPSFNYTGSGNTTLNNRQFELYGTTANTVFAINNNGTGSFTINTDLLVSAAGTKTLTLGGSNTTAASTFGGVISNGSGTINLIKAGASTWVLTNANTYTGTTTISGGTLRLSGGNNRLATTGVVNFSGTSTFSIADSQTLSNVTVADGVTGTITGGGSLTLNGSAFSVGGSADNTSQTLNLGGLNTFVYNNNTGTFRVGGTVGTGNNTTAGTLSMPGVATITASSFGVGSINHSSGSGPNTGTLNLGATTTINADTVQLGNNQAKGTIRYASGTVNPSLVLRGSDGSSPVTSMLIGTSGGFNSATYDSLVDLTTNVTAVSGGLDAKVTTLVIGQWNRNTAAAGNPITTGELRMGLGTLEATTITLGRNAAGGSGAASASTVGTLSVTGGTVKVGTLYLADQNATTNNAVTGTFNLNGGGTLIATTVSKGLGAGTDTATCNFNWSSGTISNTLGSNLTWNDVAITLSAGTHTFNISGSNTATLNSGSAIGGGAFSITKTGTGTLTLSAANTYTGATTVSQGTLLVNGSINSATTVASGATLGGSGTINSSVTINAGGTLAAGNSIDSLASGNLTLAAAAIFAYEMDNDAAAGVAGDLMAVTGNLTLDAGNASILTLTELGAGSWTAGESLTLISYSGTWNGGLFTYSSTVINDGDTINFSGMNWLVDYNDTTAGDNYTGDLTGASFVTMTAIPEPGVSLLAGVTLLGLFLRRRRC